MPFTIAHTIAVIPLYKYLGKSGAFSALIIGSMTPDFAYLTPFLVDQRMDSHSFIGVYLYCIPMGLTIYFLYHYLMAPVIVSQLPQSLQKHLHSDLFIGKIPKIPSTILIFSLVLGAFTHIFWDFFTHQSGLPQFIGWMDIPLSNIDGYNIMPYRLLQHFSSIFGLILLVFLILRWYQRKEQHELEDSHPPQEMWRASKGLVALSRYTLLIIPTVTGVMSGYINIPDTDVMYGLYSAQVFIRYAIVGAAGGFITSCVLLGLVYQYKIYKRTKRGFV